MNGMFGYMLRGALAGPCAIMAGIAALLTICGCVRCMRCRMRDCACCKRCLRITGHDRFDDFELMMLVHQAMFDRQEAKLTTVVRVTAGVQSVRTDPNSNGIFQQPLQIFVEQGAQSVIVDMLDSRDRVLATLTLDTMKDVLGPSVHQPEHVYTMKQKGKGLRNPRIKLTMTVQQDEDLEKGLLAGISSDVDSLVRLQLAKAQREGLSELEVLKQACGGPLELFERLGKTRPVHVAILGPPVSKRYVLGIWQEKHDFDAKKRVYLEVDMLRIESVQADPTRHHVFVINYYDESRVPQALTFRRIDRGRDVWVEMIRLLVQKVREAREIKKDKRERAMTGERTMSYEPTYPQAHAKARCNTAN